MGQKDNHVMEKEQRREAKQHLVVLMHQGISWKEARATVGVHISRSTAYRWVQGVQSRGEAALLDGRHGHPTQLREAVLQWLVATCRANPQMPRARQCKPRSKNTSTSTSVGATSPA